MSRILIVDDEPMLVGLLKRYLERQGFTVDTCPSPEEALKTFRAAPDAFDLVLTDLSLEGMNGEEMLKEMRSVRAAFPAIIASGYPFEPQLKNVRFLQKPFLPQMLADEIAKALKPGSRGAAS